MQDCRNLIRHGGLRPDRDILQFDPALSYGLVEYLRTLDDAEGARLVAAALRAAWRPPVRAQHRRRPASAATKAYPQVFAPFGGFADDCAGASTAASRMPDAPGIGFERKANLWAVMKDL